MKFPSAHVRRVLRFGWVLLAGVRPLAGQETELIVEPILGLDLDHHVTLALGPSLRYSSTVKGKRCIDLVQPYGYGHFGRVGAVLGIQIDTRDHPIFPTRGILISAGASLFPALWDVRSTFGAADLSAAAYLAARALPTRPVVALRAGTKRVFGTYPYQEAAYIGGTETVRLGWVNRLGGDQAVWGNVELRLTLDSYRVLKSGQWGVFGLTDVGRVFLAGESSRTWRIASGGVSGSRRSRHPIPCPSAFHDDPYGAGSTCSQASASRRTPCPRILPPGNEP
ncbi:MAG: BamA/TamA family outer membrane protein [Gemmatimonadota bacterium]|nr:BamA/TamA family outer membrane protein [Gemmatimonadota bacterium]